MITLVIFTKKTYRLAKSSLNQIDHHVHHALPLSQSMSFCLPCTSASEAAFELGRIRI